MAEQSKSPEDQVPVEELTPEEANRIIHSHRKVRYGTACWPCRQRKVKCDNKQPCDNCVKRDHAQLCSYKPNRSTTAKRSHSGSERGQARKRSLSHSDSHIESRKAERLESWPRNLDFATNVEDSDSATDRYLGQNSIPALLREQSSQELKHDSADVRRDMRSILGLDNNAPFPLMSSKHLDRMTKDIIAELPSDREVMKLFRTYKEVAQAFWGFIYDINDLESKLMIYLEDRSRNATGTSKSTRPVTATWLAILFGVLAVGSQYHESPYHVRTQNSQKYVQIAFHFLRLGNFLLRPSFDSIQALLLVSFTLVNDMKAEASWALNALTCRLAQSLGLHRPSPIEGQESAPEDAKTKDMIRRKLWWTCVWHDTLTSLSFDRCTVTNFPSCIIPVRPNAADLGYTYLEAMYRLIEIISRRLSPDALATATYQDIIDNCETIESLRGSLSLHVRDREKCRTALDRLHYFAIRLHTSFISSVACRPALRRDCNFDPEQKKELGERCKANLSETVRMFLAMHQLSVIPTRSWAFTYHGLSSALLLGILCETKADPEARQLQGDLIAALSATAAREESSPQAHVPVTDKDIELSGPLHRALLALKNIYDHGSVSGSSVKREGDSSNAGSGSRTPLLSLQQGQVGVTSNPQLRNPQPGADPREDAAMAMAEMQNGASLQDFQNMAYGQQLQPTMSLDNLADLNVDSSQYMAPMDLYESIWGGLSTIPLSARPKVDIALESPDPWSNSMDAMNFDFLAQPPPGQVQQQFYF